MPFKHYRALPRPEPSPRKENRANVSSYCAGCYSPTKGRPSLGDRGSEKPIFTAVQTTPIGRWNRLNWWTACPFCFRENIYTIRSRRIRVGLPEILPAKLHV